MHDQKREFESHESHISGCRDLPRNECRPDDPTETATSNRKYLTC